MFPTTYQAVINGQPYDVLIDDSNPFPPIKTTRVLLSDADVADAISRGVPLQQGGDRVGLAVTKMTLDREVGRYFAECDVFSELPG